MSIKCNAKTNILAPFWFNFRCQPATKLAWFPTKQVSLKPVLQKEKEPAFFLESTDPILETQSHCKTPQELCVDTGIAQQELLGLFHHSIFSLVENAREDAIGYCKIQTVLFAISQPSDTIYNLKLKNCSKDSIAKRKIID